MNWQSLIEYLKENEFQILNEISSQNSLFFTVIPDCMLPFRIEIQRGKKHISSRLLIDYNEYNDVRSVLRAFQPQESLYRSIKYYQNGKEIYRDNHGRFVVFDETSIKQLLEVIVETAIEREIDYFHALEDLIFKASFAFSSKCFLNTMRAADIATEYWPESCFMSVEWENYTVKPLRANLPFLNIDMILLCDNSLVIRIYNKTDKENMLVDISNKTKKCVSYSTMNETFLELVVTNYNLSTDSSKLRNIIEIIDTTIGYIPIANENKNVERDCSIIHEEKEFKFKAKDRDGKIQNFQAFCKIEVDDVNYLFYTNDPMVDELTISVCSYSFDNGFINLHPIETEQEWNKLESIFNEIIEEKVRNFYKNI